MAPVDGRWDNLVRFAVKELTLVLVIVLTIWVAGFVTRDRADRSRRRTRSRCNVAIETLGRGYVCNYLRFRCTLVREVRSGVEPQDVAPPPLRARRVGGPHNRAGALDLTRSFRQRVLALKGARAMSAYETLLLAIMRADREVQDRRDRQEITYASLRHAAVMVMMAASSHPVGTKPPSIISC